MEKQKISANNNNFFADLGAEVHDKTGLLSLFAPVFSKELVTLSLLKISKEGRTGPCYEGFCSLSKDLQNTLTI